VWSTGQLLFRELWSTGHLLSDIVVAGKVERGLHRVAASTVPSSIIAPASKDGIQMGYKLFLSTMLSFYNIYTSSPINSASSLSSSSVRSSGTSF